MVYTVTITSQGQISIPAKLRKKLGFGKKAVVSEENGRIIIEPVKDFLEMGGSLTYKAIKDKPIEEVMRLEEEAIEKGWTERYEKQMQVMDKPKRK